ncbi:MAG: site-specific tyrosine recombinase XerD [Bacteroidota bacterium]|nr:site-specific tyrosine recombinase XerD [Bacteroidota bacterium]
MWRSLIKNFERYLRLERNLAKNTVINYLKDLDRFSSWCEQRGLPPRSVKEETIRKYLRDLASHSAKSQARHISSLRSFFQFLLYEEIISIDPTEMIESPKLPRYLPDTLSELEVLEIIQAVDRSTPTGERDKAILETLYGCGVRVSELVEIKLSDLFFDQQVIRVIGKGNKERVIPINPTAMRSISIYRDEIRVHQDIQRGFEDHLFLNNRGKKLTRVMIFHIVKKLAEKAGIRKKISPHTFRHSFATHLIRRGADIRVVQELLGHESILTTEIYTHLSANDLRDTILHFHPRVREDRPDQN